MKYYEDLIDRGGFRNGTAIPPDAEAMRDIYVFALNYVANKYGSTVEAYACDASTHNLFRICFRNKQTQEEVHPNNVDGDMDDAISGCRLDYGDQLDFEVLNWVGTKLDTKLPDDWQEIVTDILDA